MKLITFVRRIGDLMVAMWNGNFAVTRDGVLSVSANVAISKKAD